MPWTRIAAVSEVPVGAARFFCVGARSVVIANRAGEFFAVDGICPHKGFELDNAQLWDDVIECPWHRYQYSIRTGENCFPQNVYPRDRAEPVQPIATYPVELRGPEIWVNLA